MENIPRCALYTRSNVVFKEANDSADDADDAHAGVDDATRQSDARDD